MQQHTGIKLVRTTLFSSESNAWQPNTKNQEIKVKPEGTTQIRTQLTKKTRQTGSRTEGLAYVHRRVGRQ